MLATIPVYTNSEDGLYGPAIDNDFATNHWVYLYYAPPTVTSQAVRRHHRDVTTPTRPAPDYARPTAERLGPVVGLLPALAVQVRRRCHPVAGPRDASRRSCRSPTTAARAATSRGDIDFDTHNNLWLVTGDDTPSGGGNSGGFSPHNDLMTETRRCVNAHGGTFTLTFDGQTTAPIPQRLAAIAPRSRR